MYVLEEIAFDGTEQVRLEAFCRGKFKIFPSHKSVKKAIKKGAIRLNNEVIEAGRFLNHGDTIQALDLEENPPKAFPLAIEILWEDEHLAVVFKPAGIPTSGNLYRTLENAIQGQVKISSLPDKLAWPKPVHRLDAPTSGLVIIAKSIPARITLGQMLEDRSIQKTYTAVVKGKFEVESLEINSLINGKSAHSSLKVLTTQPSLRNEFLSLVELQPHTGRTHQLRIHCANEGHPIVGDLEYDEKGKVLEHKGLFLCATRLDFHHPITCAPLLIEADAPKKFRKLMEMEEERFGRLK